VGYELYCELLEGAVRRLQSLPPAPHADVNIDLPGEAYLPDSLVPHQRAKIDLYRRLARISSFDDLLALRDEIRDRFGELPALAQRLLDLAGLRLEAAVWAIEAIQLEKKSGQPYLVLRFRDLHRMRQLARAARLPVRIVDDTTAYVPLPKAADDPQEILTAAVKLLQVSAKQRTPS
jgi:transcription-repair coupling factor (superfamily II helicase)